MESIVFCTYFAHLALRFIWLQRYFAFPFPIAAKVYWNDHWRPLIGWSREHEHSSSGSLTYFFEIWNNFWYTTLPKSGVYFVLSFISSITSACSFIQKHINVFRDVTQSEKRNCWYIGTDMPQSKCIAIRAPSMYKKNHGPHTYWPFPALTVVGNVLLSVVIFSLDCNKVRL